VDKPLVSTITPSFRTKKYIRGFLEALPKQTFFEHIEVVLDHNEPDEEEIQLVEDFQARYPGRLKHLIVDPVVPIGTSMNNCIEAASADLVTIWNVDDLRTPESIELQARLLLDRADADIAYGDWLEVSSFGSTAGERVDCSHFSPDEFTRGMLLGPFFMFRKALCEKAGMFDEQLVSGADLDLAIRLGFHGRPAYAPGLLGYHLNEGMGASSRPGNKQMLERTVIELRYGIFDKIDYDYLAPALRYTIPKILQRGEWSDVATYVPNYEATMQERAARWLRPGLKRQNVRFWFEDRPRLVRAVRWARNRLRSRPLGQAPR
jgi:GT2 family glycosyltransferase